MTRHRHRMGAAVLSLAALTDACPVLAQPAALPNTVRPGAVERALQQALPEIHEDHVQLPAPSGFEAPQGAADFHFVLRRVTVEGATALSADAIAATHASLTGREISLADIYDVARRITDAYARAGYALSFALVPAQDIDKATGAVRIAVVEGYVSEVRFDGDTEGLAQIVNDYGENITRSRPLRTDALERYLLLMNDLPGYRVSGVFDNIPGAERGATRLIVKVTHKPVDLAAGIDNRGSRAFGPEQASVNVVLNNMLGQGESLLVHGLRALNRNELSALVARGSLPLNGEGLTLNLGATFSDAHPGSASLAALNFASTGWTVSASLNYPLWRGREESLWLWGGVSGKWLRSLLASTPNSRDRIYALQGGLTWNARDGGGVTSADATLTQGLDIFGATSGSDLLRSRLAGGGAFTSLTATVTRLMPLGGGDAGQFDFQATAMGQLASRGLLSAEQCGYGGALFGRAFDANEVVGDHCLLGSAELRLTPDLPESWTSGGVLDALQLYSVFDLGATWQTGRLGFGDKAQDSGGSIGLGVRFGLFGRVTAQVEFDQPLFHRVALEGNRDGRVFFQIGIAN